MREFLKGLELDSDLINQIMKHYGTIEKSKDVEISTLEKELKKYEGIDVEKLKGIDVDALNSKISDYEAKIKELEDDTTVTNLTNEVKTLREEKILSKHGITDDEEREVYSIRLNRLVTDEKDFETTAKEYFEANPIKVVPPAFHTGEGKSVVNTGVTKEDFNKMNWSDKIQFKQSNPESFKKFTQKNQFLIEKEKGE